VKTAPLAMLLLAFTTASATSQAELDELIARAKSLELDTPYVPPAGDPLAYHAADEECGRQRHSHDVNSLAVCRALPAF
jgi:hypothetical protein